MSSIELEEAGRRAWELHQKRHNSPVVAIYQGQLLSRVQCDECNATSPTFDPMMLLSLPVHGTTVYDCLQHFTQVEDMASQWACPICSGPRLAKKRLQLSRLPEDVLLLQLKRFRQSVLSSHGTKLGTMIDFPLRGLDMSPYVFGSMHGPSLSQSPNPLWDLVAVVNHVGILSEGHYFALAKHEGTGGWYEFNDASCSPKREDEIVTANAYLLVYQRRREAPAGFADK
jgi:ubiquitin C-terminal hydrolase